MRGAPVPGSDAGPLRPCPFCGGAAALEADPWLPESLRVACGNGTCPVRPRTEYLLPRFADELCAAWNGRLRGRTEAAGPPRAAGGAR